MAEWLNFLSAVIIVGCFLILGRFVIRLCVMEREAMFDYVNLPPREIPSQAMIGVKNPFILTLKTADPKSSSSTTSTTGNRVRFKRFIDLKLYYLTKSFNIRPPNRRLSKNITCRNKMF